MQRTCELVKDRPGHDRRYAICQDKTFGRFGIPRADIFVRRTHPDDRLVSCNEAWWRPLLRSDYQNWIKFAVR